MGIIAILLVIASGLTHALWNLLTKQSVNKALFLASIYAFPSLILLPVLVVDLSSAELDGRGVLALCSSFLLQACYALLLARIYTQGDLSQAYPLMRGSSTLLIPLFGVMLLEETLSLWGWIGLLVILAGSFYNYKSVSLRSINNNWQTMGYALLIGLVVSCYVIADKYALNYVSPVGLLGLSCLGFFLAQLPAAFPLSKIVDGWKLQSRMLILGSILSPGSYLLFLFAMNLAPVSQLSPLRETGTVFGALLGVLILREGNAAQRLISAFLITFGILLIGFAG